MKSNGHIPTQRKISTDNHIWSRKGGHMKQVITHLLFPTITATEANQSQQISHDFTQMYCCIRNTCMIKL